MSSSPMKRVEVWAFKKPYDNSQDDGRSQLLVSICHAMQVSLSEITSFVC